MDYSEGYAEYGERGEYSDVSLRSDLGSNYGEDPPMEVEEVLHGDSRTDIDVHSGVSGNDEPPTRMIPPKAPAQEVSTKCKQTSTRETPRGDLVRGGNSLYQGIQPRKSCSCT
ncbi:hypothetical protein P4O66_001860 [Electrophorus voltai]|uniref:Uncharacterized protein n=1 Tax=Electrophorus voltai TaxID=2609070 RepID=A0AAD8Z3V0_9TELE|nr:hypothetical protein P4O66_001860 [Electrophorus voltai]